MDFAFEFDFFFILGSGLEWRTSDERGRERSTLYGAYHFARRVLPLWHGLVSGGFAEVF